MELLVSVTSMEKIVKKNPFQSAKVQAQMLSQSGIQMGQFGMHRDIFTPHVILDFFLVVFFIFARLETNLTEMY
jgi:hypothetical protein